MSSTWLKPSTRRLTVENVLSEIEHVDGSGRKTISVRRRKLLVHRWDWSSNVVLRKTLNIRTSQDDSNTNSQQLDVAFDF
jgi:hypothetical protein